MKKSRIFIALATISLTAAGILASHANKKFAYNGPFYTCNGSMVLSNCGCLANVICTNLTFDRFYGYQTLAVFGNPIYGINGVAYRLLYY